MPMSSGGAAGVAAALGAWVATMVPMMLPSVAPALWRHRRAAGARRAAAAGVGYVAVWAAAGLVAMPLGAALAATGPVAAAAAVAAAGLWQLTPWKARGLAGCADLSRGGVALGVRCVRSCGNLMVLLLAAGMMDPRRMLAVTAAVTAERLLPSGRRVARGTGVLALAAAVVLLVTRAAP